MSASNATVSPPRLHRAALGRGDLLRALQSAPSAAEAILALMGFAPKEESPAAPEIDSHGKGSVTVSASEPDVRKTETRLPLLATHYLVVQTPVSEPAAAEQDLAEPLDAIPESNPGLKPISPRLLAPKARLAGLARRYLRRPAPSRLLDLDRWIALVARAELPSRLPTRRLRQWGSSAALVVNGYGCRDPIFADLSQLVDVVRGHSAGATPVYWLNPEGRWLQLLPGRGERRWKYATAPEQSLHWLFAGADALSPTGWQWSTLVAERLRMRNSVTWVKAGAQTAGDMPAGLRMVRWDIGSALRECRPQQSAAQRVNELIAALALAVRVEPALLREIRLLLKLPGEAEMAAWSHADVYACAVACCVRPERIAHWRAQARDLLMPEQREAIVRCIVRHHRTLSPLIQSEEAAIAVDLAPDAVDAVARERWRQVLATLQAQPHGMPAQAVANYLRRLGGRADAALFQGNHAVAEAWLLAEREALNAGTVDVPEGISAAMTQRVLSLPTDASTTEEWSLLQRGAALWMVPGRRRNALARLPQAGRGVLMEQRSGRRWLCLGNQELRLDNAWQEPLRLRHGGLISEISRIPRPAWAHEFGRDSRGVYAMSPPLGIFQERFDARLEAPGRGVSFVSEGRWHKKVHLSNKLRIPDLSYAIGVDHRYGVYANIRLGDATQRFRWIAPGEFWMGSTDAERARITDKRLAELARDEAPRHRVKLTRGYWMADTPCTQAFWFALMHSNPSQFQDKAEHPVENVSWNHIQPALQVLTALLPVACEADLPTEAEWEYACRAGTSKAFFGGDGLTAEQARFFGADAFGIGGDEFGTAKVASYPANPWGLFDMHGNVWELCRDGLRQYQDLDALDPEGPQGDERRALRGGSWLNVAGNLRAAYRRAYSPGDRYRRFGLRLVLRSRSQVALPEAVPESAPEAPTTAPRDVEPSLRERVQPLIQPKKGNTP